jgi:hypothetical protein
LSLKTRLPHLSTIPLNIIAAFRNGESSGNETRKRTRLSVDLIGWRPLSDTAGMGAKNARICYWPSI